MSELKMDDVLSGVIIVLVMIIIVKWYKNNYLGGGNSRTCSCNGRVCTCDTNLSYSQKCRIGCKGGTDCRCGCPPMKCICPMTCACNYKYRENMENNDIQGYKPDSKYTGDNSFNMIANDVTGPDPSHVASMGPIPRPAAEKNMSDWSGSITKGIALEDGVSDSHQRYCDSLSFAGMPTGASSCTTLEETGRSYGTSDFVGLTARKFCKARQLASPGCDSRQTPSQNITEWCNIDMNELV
jgi:hypothetical protein